MGLGRKVAADLQGLGQPRQLPFGGLRQRMDVPGGDVRPRPADGRQPQVGGDEVGGQQSRRPAPQAVAAARRVAGPAQPLETEEVEGEKHPDDGEVVVEIAQVEHAAGDGLEARAGAEQRQHAPDLVAEQGGQGVRADQVEQAADHRRQDQRDDGVVGAGAHVQADGHIGRGQEQRGDVAADHRPPVQRPQERDRHRQRQGERQGQRHQPEGRGELAQHQGERRHRRGEQVSRVPPRRSSDQARMVSAATRR